MGLYDGTNKQGKEVTHTFENVSSAGYEVILASQMQQVILTKE